MPGPTITSPKNPRVKALIALRRRRIRDGERVCVVEGSDELTLALAAGVRPRELYWCPELAPDPSAAATVVDRAVAAGAELLRLSRVAFEKASYRQGPDGLLALVPAMDHDLGALRLPGLPIVVVAQGVEKPGNLGAMLRTADAAGVAAVIAADPVTDWANPNVIRASKGTVFAVPVATASTDAVLDWLTSQRIPLVATTPAAEQSYDAVDYRGPVAVAVGAEQTGLTDALLAAADQTVVIPMSGLVNSLNVATSMAVVVFEAMRQRRTDSS